MTPRRVAAIFLLRDDGAALLQHRDDKPDIPHPNMWVPPGGHCEDGESIDACARREFLEETGVAVERLHLLADFIDDNAQGFPPLHLVVFWARYDGRQRIECHEGQALEFVPRSRAEALAVPGYLARLWDRARAAMEAAPATGVAGAGQEVNLLDRYPRAKRPLAANRSASDEFRQIARRFGREYFDGDRTTGYGGYRYDGRWVPIAERIRDHYGLRAGHRVLDIGCAKGFLMHDLQQAVPGLEVVGIDISQYGLQEAVPAVRGRIIRGTAQHLPFASSAFDLVLAINVLHNLERDACVEAMREMERVGRGGKYVQVDSWLNEEQRRNLDLWVLTALTYVDPDEWRELFREAGYTGDYYWTLTE